VWSRNGADLTAGFPDIVDAACEQLQPGTVVDGELVVWSEGRLDFAALAPRLAYRGRRRPPAQLAPAAILAFDLLAAGDADVRGKPLRVRRSLLEQLAETWRPPLQLTPQTADPAQARRWLKEYAAADVGVEGLVAKGANQRYLPGQRGWVKLRIHNTREATVGLDPLAAARSRRGGQGDRPSARLPQGSRQVWLAGVRPTWAWEWISSAGESTRGNLSAEHFRQHHR
jgi:ATP-dependent DNA ligase